MVIMESKVLNKLIREFRGIDHSVSSYGVEFASLTAFKKHVIKTKAQWPDYYVNKRRNDCDFIWSFVVSSRNRVIVHELDSVDGYSLHDIGNLDRFN